MSHAIRRLSTIFRGRVRCVDFAGAAGVLAYGGAGNRHIMHNPGNRPTPMSQTRGFLVELGSAVTVAIFFFCLFVTRSGRGDGDAASNAAVYRLPRRESRCNGAYHALNWRIVAWCYAGWLLTPPTAGAMKVVLSILAFFFLFITRVRPMEIMARLCAVRSCPLSAQWRLVASTPLPSAQACPKKERCRTKEIIRGNKKGNHKGKKSGMGRKSGGSSLPSSSASTPCSSSHSRTSSSDTALPAPSFSPGTRLSTSVVARKSSTARLHLPSARRSCTSETSCRRNRYSAYDRELLAISANLDHWTCYVHRRKRTTIYTDHAALQHILGQNKLQQHDYKVKYYPGVVNVVADALSRIAYTRAPSVAEANLVNVVELRISASQ